MSTQGQKREISQQRPKLLLGKGNSPSSSHLQSLLPKLGYQLIVVNDGLEARAILQKEDAPQLAVLDANMAGLPATDLCRDKSWRRLDSSRPGWRMRLIRLHSM